MSYVTQIQELDKEAAQQVLFDALNVRAMAALSDMKNEGTSAKKLDEDTDQLDEARKVGEYTKDNHSATIHKEDDEYRVKFHKDGKHLPDADYFTDDKEDAEGTAKHQVNAMCAK